MAVQIPIAQRIDELLHRRGDLSTFLVHLTAAGVEAETNLISILSGRKIEARNPYGLLRDFARDNAEAYIDLYQSQRVVCLTETPLEHVWMMCANIADRGHPLSSYGIAFAKPWAREIGANPVWYIDMLRTGHRGWDWLTKPLMNLAKQTLQEGGKKYADPFKLGDGVPPNETGLTIAQSPVAQIAPFIETMGPVGPEGQTRRREFWWEREWRYRGDLEFKWSEVVAIFAPADRHDVVRTALAAVAGAEDVPALLDPTWGLERMIAALANVPAEYAGPLPRY